ncbi:YcaO-like family protein [Geminicoccus roseus]|uniref:YcaO-like family protein n=1 Tax=Geminicoccus roseus TaxID=404900 RepID=UPI0004014AB7|nr:YcaO-like family protein [Geminicoccus roseus]
MTTDHGTRTDPAQTAPTAKRWWTGSHRIRLPEATLADLEPLLPFYGITRLADLTGLDRVGVPVWAAVRPRTRSLSVSQGKGIDPIQARVSAIVEAIELWSAERVEPAGLRRGGEPLVEASDLDTGQAATLPWAEVSLDARTATRPRPRASSNGLSGGNCRDEAILHGLCELVERDALARAVPTARFAGGLPRIDPGGIEDPLVRRLLRQLDDAGVLHAVWRLPACVELPVFLCHVMDDQAVGDDGRGWAHGSGCHPDPVIAWLRAVTEALQARLTHIAGARDDTGWDRFQALSSERVERQRAALQGGGRMEGLPGPGRLAPGVTIQEDVHKILSALLRAGKGPFRAVDLPCGPAPLAVVKLAAPALQEPVH